MYVQLCYVVRLDPINIYHDDYSPSNDPIRLCYDGMHYDSIVDPKKATIGVGLGLPGLQPGVRPMSLGPSFL